MPVKITLSGSIPEDGLISKEKVTQIVDDFNNLAELKPKSTRPVIKKLSVLFPVNQMQELIQNQGEFKYVNVQFALTLPDQKSCADNFVTDISNQLTVLLNIATFQNNLLTDHLNDGDFVLTVGYKEFREDKAARLLAPCCGNPR